MIGTFVGGEAEETKEEFELHPEWTYLRAIIRNPGGPLYMLPPESYVYEGGFGR
jgi:hypothetical protein